MTSFRLDEVMPEVYAELRTLAERHMRSERGNHTLQPSALVHELYVRLRKSDDEFLNRAHFFAAASEAIRRILIEHARRVRSVKRGGDAGPRVALDDALGLTAPPHSGSPGQSSGQSSGGVGPGIDILDIGDALSELERMDERLGRVVTLRFFGGLTVDEVAASLGLSKRTVESDWTVARAWLRRRLAGAPAEGRDEA